MSKYNRKRRIGKKAFISSILVDFWSYILFIFVVILFFIIYKWSAEARLQELEDVRDITYGNYLAQVYLRTPLNVGDEKMTMAELISFYDYNQSLEQELNGPVDRLMQGTADFFMGRTNSMWEGIESVSDDFIDRNFESDKCFVFAIEGNAFTYSRFSYRCPTGNAFAIGSVLSQFNVPNATFVTYVPSVDPRNDPIRIYSIYDLDRLIELYAQDAYTDMGDWRRNSVRDFCAQNPQIENCVSEMIGDDEI